jgi:hypothetical protein
MFTEASFGQVNSDDKYLWSSSTAHAKIVFSLEELTPASPVQGGVILQVSGIV